MATDDPRMGEFDRLLSGYTNGLFAAGDPEDWFTTDDLRSWVAANLVPAPAGERAELVKRLREEARTWRELIEEEAVGNRLDKPVFYFERMIALIEHAADALEAGERTLRICGWCGKEMDRRAAREPTVAADEFFRRYNAGIESERRLDPDSDAESRPVSALDGDWPEVDAVLADKTGDKIGGGSVIADALEAQLSKIPGEFETRLAALEARHARLGAEVGDEIRALRHRVGELEDRVERLGDDSQEHHDRLWTLEDALAARENPTGDPQPAERVTGDPQ